MTIIEGILAYMAGEAESLPATNTEAERLLAKAAERIVASLVPTPKAADEGKVLTANDDGTAGWAAIPAEQPAAET